MQIYVEHCLSLPFAAHRVPLLWIGTKKNNKMRKDDEEDERERTDNFCPNVVCVNDIHSQLR